MLSSLVASALVLAAPGLARAQGNPGEQGFRASFEYVAPVTCPSSDEFEAIVVGRLGFDPFEGEARHHVLVEISQGPRALEGRLEWRNAGGKWAGDQTFPARARDCDELTRTIGFALAVQINLMATGEMPAPVDEPTAAEEAGAPRSSTLEATPAPPPRTAQHRPNPEPSERGEASARWVPGLGIGGSVAVGLSPGPIALGRVFGSLGRGSASLELGAELTSTSTGHREDGAGFEAHALLASAAACGSRPWWTACLLAKIGVLNVSGQRVDVPESSRGAAAQLGLRAGLRQRAGSLFIVERAEGLFNLTRSTVTIDALPVWTAPRFAASFGLDVGFAFD